MRSGRYICFRLAFFIFFFFQLTSFVHPQKTTVLSMPDNGVFILESGDTVIPYGVRFISMSENDTYDWKFLNNMRTWLSDYYVNRSFSVVILDTINSRKFHAKMFREHLVNSTDAIELVLSYGYARIDTTVKDTYVSNLYSFQSRAIKDKSGMWRTSSLAVNNKPESNQPPSITWNPPKPSNYYKLNIPLLSLSLLSFGLAYDYFVQVSDLGDLIEDLEKIGFRNTGDLQSQKTRKTFLGIFSLFAGLVTLNYSFENIELNGSINQLNLKYKF